MANYAEDDLRWMDAEWDHAVANAKAELMALINNYDFLAKMRDCEGDENFTWKLGLLSMTLDFLRDELARWEPEKRFKQDQSAHHSKASPGGVGKKNPAPLFFMRGRIVANDNRGGNINAWRSRRSQSRG
jgi:hypothetical protein